MLEIEIKLLIAFHSQIDRQTERTNQKLEQYLRIYINYRQNNWSEQLAIAEFTFNNKMYIATKLSPFNINYRRELRMNFQIRKKEKHVKVEEFVKETKEIVTNFIQLVSPQPVDRFSQTKLRWKALNESYSHICGMYKSNNKRLRYQAISSCKSFVC